MLTATLITKGRDASFYALEPPLGGHAIVRCERGWGEIHVTDERDTQVIATVETTQDKAALDVFGYQVVGA